MCCNVYIITRINRLDRFGLYSGRLENCNICYFWMKQKQVAITEILR